MQKQLTVKLLFGLYPRYENHYKGKGITVPFHATKAYMRHRSIATFILNLGTMEMNGYLHAPAALLPENPGTHLMGGCAGPRAGLDVSDSNPALSIPVAIKVKQSLDTS